MSEPELSCLEDLDSSLDRCPRSDLGGDLGLAQLLLWSRLASLSRLGSSGDLDLALLLEELVLGFLSPRAIWDENVYSGHIRT